MTAKQSIDYIESHYDQFTEELIRYAKIPSVSFPGYPKEPLQQSAEWTADRMRQAGLENVEILRVAGAPPYVYGDWIRNSGLPTVLLYGHHDVQPPGRESHWKSPAFEPEKREGRLYGRGVVDDKAGVMMHLAAIESYLKTEHRLPVNVRFIVEGEEETGSAHLAPFLKEYQSKLQSNFMVLTDTANLEEGLPSITYRLRGIVDAVVEVRTLDHPIHSGMWGGPVVDALTVLNQILARLLTPEGKIAIPRFYEGALEPDSYEKGLLSKLPFHREKFRKQIGMASTLVMAGENNFTIHERMWCRPALAVLAIDAPRIEGASNQIVEVARAKVSVRIVSGQDPRKSLQRLCDFLKHNPPYGAKIEVYPGAAGEPWKVDPKGPAFEAAALALEKGFEKKPVFIGCGGSIPFVKPFTEVFQGIPALLIGIEDPTCNAHGENESLSLSDWKKGMRSAVYLYEELGKV